jgi:hypothetical protein
MTDFHHNIFYYYRGAQRSGQDRDQQLEDNTTKALINTLECCSPMVALKFLAWLGIAATEPVKFELQKETIGEGKIRRKSQRLLLGLVPSRGTKDPCTGSERPAAEDGRPDTWIYRDDFVVLIESKVKGSLHSDQVQRYSQKLQAGTKQLPRYEVRTWAKVHQFFASILPELSDEKDKDKWIVKQFTQYLEWNGMAEFTGLEEGIFDFFVTHDDEDTRQWVRDTVQSFAEKIKAELLAFDSFYQSYHMGTLHLKDEACWVAFGPGDHEFKQWAHQTISLNAYALDVFINVELKPAIDRLKGKIRQDRKAFREVIARLPVPFSIQLEERKKKQAAQFDYYIIARLEAGYRKDPNPGPYGLKDPQSDGFDYIEKFLEQIDLPCLSVRRHIDRNQALGLSQGGGSALVAEVVGIMKAFHPLVEFINEPDYTCHRKS